jgi:serine/threonine protein kinase
MSPEQAEGKKVDARSDIFSFGAVLYEMVTGQKAFVGESNLAILTAILRDEPQSASEIVKGLPQEVAKILNRCLRKDRERRHQHMADVKITLQELKEDSDSGTLAWTQPVVRPTQRAWVCTRFRGDSPRHLVFSLGPQKTSSRTRSDSTHQLCRH